MDILNLAKRVKRGVRLLDAKVPNWRKTMQKHQGQFDFKNGDCCILGTLEHYNGRMQTLRKKTAEHDSYRFTRAKLRLRVNNSAYTGFSWLSGVEKMDEVAPVLEALWRAEFEA